jgi:hypothetical protein
MLDGRPLTGPGTSDELSRLTQVLKALRWRPREMTPDQVEVLRFVFVTAVGPVFELRRARHSRSIGRDAPADETRHLSELSAETSTRRSERVGTSST